MTPALFVTLAIRPAFARLLPGYMNTAAAQAMVLAICLQESGLVARTQVPHGPGRGFAQFEAGGGVAGVLTHPATTHHAHRVCQQLCVLPAATAVHRALEHNDALTVTFARLLLWTLPDPLPEADQPRTGWEQYLAAWRPGIPRPETWPAAFATAWHHVRTDGDELPTGTPRSSWGYDVPPPTGR